MAAVHSDVKARVLFRDESVFRLTPGNINTLEFSSAYPQDGLEQRLKKHDLTDVRGTAGKDVRDLVKNGLNPVLRGWGNYFEKGNPSQVFRDLDLYVWRRLTRWMWRRGGQRTRFWPSKWPFRRVEEELGLHRLSDRFVYLSEAAPRRPLESRVRETASTV